MELLQNVAKLQSSQVTQSIEATEAANVAVQPTQLQQTAQEANAAPSETERAQRIESTSDVEKLVKQLNQALDPFRTSLRFGFDDNFYVSVIETKTDKLIRRFPAEEAVNLLPKIEDLNGFLFDEKG